ncbi:MAG: nitroreductase [Candidatus Aminicenantes bacterium RBG_16_63_16]|nr:MAG: nitroreductase [Candidatus Aminicenantes bacterium RBG_16_63_16]
MTLYELIISRRSIRQFRPEPLARPVLEKIVNAGRLAPSASNLQPLEFIVVDDERVRREIFSFVRWADYISPAGNPLPGQEPTAYVIPLVNLGVRRSGFDLDLGAAVENMILAAWEEGIGSCWIAALDVKGVSRAIGLRENFRLTCALALGYPAETPVVEDFGGSVKYWKEDDGVLHVPKKKLADILHYNRVRSGT